MYACMYACMHVCMHVCMYAYMHVCMYVCMFVYVISICLGMGNPLSATICKPPYGDLTTISPTLNSNGLACFKKYGETTSVTCLYIMYVCTFLSLYINI